MSRKTKKLPQDFKELKSNLLRLKNRREIAEELSTYFKTEMVLEGYNFKFKVKSLNERDISKLFLNSYSAKGIFVKKSFFGLVVILEF